MDTGTLIRKTRDRQQLGRDEIRWLVRRYARGGIPDYQMAAWLMAVRCRGLSAGETAALTGAIIDSGSTFDFSDLPKPKVDKHSTGGVGDKVSLILAPLVAACGVAVPMVSGRSLGHTGGTLDKLESIPGFRTALAFRQFKRVVGRVGCGIMGQTDRFCPADRQLYALRDVTGTVDSIPLISASIMSKKLAEGIDGLVLDVKTGRGAFLPAPADARRLARSMVRIGVAMGRRVVALVTDMEQPIGAAVGNAVEVVESIEALKGRWRPDLAAVTMALGEEMLLLAGRARTRRGARRLLEGALGQGRALATFGEMVAAQGGDRRIVDDYRRLPQARHCARFRAPVSGFIRSIDALGVGRLGVDMGLGRRMLGDRVDPGAGFVFSNAVGARVERGEPVAEVFAGERSRAERAAARLAGLVRFSRSAPRPRRSVLARVGSPGRSSGPPAGTSIPAV